MFDSMSAFTRQFTPVEGGYLYYPSNKEGGKLVTAEEYDELLRDWGKVAGRSGMWKTVGIVILTIALWTMVSSALFLAEKWNSVFLTLVVIGICARLAWLSYAPRRLVKGRPAITLPRPVSEARRQVRSMLNWRLIIFAMLVSGAIFLGSLQVSDRDLAAWAWLIGSGIVFGGYIWIAIQKFRDR